MPSTTCLACEAANCPNDPTGCDAGACTAQPACSDYAKLSDRQLCAAVLDCVRISECAKGPGVPDCYCGTAGWLTACKAGFGNGVCKSQIEAGLFTTDPQTILLNLTNVRYPTGGALSLTDCDHYNCGDPTNGPGMNECEPYCH
jgi:hypothetical protein